MGESSSLSDDVMVNILLLLPAKSLARFKIVCKEWYSFIQNPNFITEYINRSDKHNRLLVITVEENMAAESFALVDPDESFSMKQKMDNPIISNGHPIKNIRQILGPVNGLYCINWIHPNDIEDSIALWNPSTSEFRQIMYPSFLFEVRPCFFGEIGFGSTDDDIKLVCITPGVAALYSLARDCWRQIEIDHDGPNILLAIMYESLTNSAYLDGAFYWLMEECHTQIYMFDMRTEVFREVPLPDECLYSLIDSIDGIFVRNNSIVLVDTKHHLTHDNLVIDIWEMKEEGCWNKIFSFVPSFSNPIPIKFWKDDEIIFVDNKYGLVLYNSRSNDSRHLGMDADFFYALDYEKSLTSVRGGNGLIRVL